MAGVMNNTARQYNLKAAGEKGNVTVRLKPGFNVVKDEHWAPVAKLNFTKELKASGKIDFGAATDKKQETADGQGKEAQSKVTPTTGKTKA